MAWKKYVIHISERKRHPERCDGLFLSASIPPNILGSNVFTRPPITAPVPVMSATDVTLTPAFSNTV